MSMRKRLRRVSVVKVAAALAVILLIYPVTIHIVRACVRAETIASPSLRSLSPETGDIGLEDGLVAVSYTHLSFGLRPRSMSCLSSSSCSSG